MNWISLLRRVASCAAVAAAIIPLASASAQQAATPQAASVFQAGATSQGAAASQAAAPTCVIPQNYARFELPLRRTTRLLAGGSPIKIVAVGSSSTSGAGATSPYNTYPSRLAAELSQEFLDHPFTVLNRGVGGDTAVDMLARFGSGVIAEKPDLVLWQVGTNSLLRGDPIQPHRTLLHIGIDRLKKIGADIVLMDPQYAPHVLAKRDHQAMLSLLRDTARVETVNIFHRFALMRHWHEVEGLPFNAFLSPDELHMNDFSYACIARALAQAIGEAATRPIASAAVPVLKR